MGGNIGLPILEQEPLPEGGVYVLELSSYQIDLTYSLACDVAVLLNITPDHLDRYDGDFAKYAASKSRLLAMQTARPERDRALHRCATLAPSPKVRWQAFSRTSCQPAASIRASRRTGHVAARSAQPRECRSRHRSLRYPGDVRTDPRGLKSFTGLPHRMERVAEISGVAYVNDSKGTNTAASAPALAAFDNIHWIVGGLGKEPGLGECEAELGHVKAAYTIGKAGPDFAALLEGRVPVEQCETLDRAVASADAAPAGDTVLLAPPAPASTNMPTSKSAATISARWWRRLA